MSFLGLSLIAVGLSMDAFAVAVCKGLSMRRMQWKNAFIVSVYFASFQAVMPLIGYYIGVQFSEHIVQVDHWVAFVLLSIIGGNMILESRNKDEVFDDRMNFSHMLILAVATSIDALAIGVTFAFLKVNIFEAVCQIGFITLFFSILGVKIGTIFGAKYKSRAEFAGGMILIFMGIKILLEHLEMLSF
ncbi:manganese efflux pump MntP family protein [Sinanaerobacter sp. ZZT-01]|uniref:manganese efflux pump MntP n=1 Tax=Sinanaerobacter sp. ZZT-01 TaxID=3111540 RepID=UPI002D78D449|nr:manganese efflux pump MntP family protein [Sinanaerobacter sp. ZZT-01]WRR93547.1 manganese efflux pump MntP family protein [Sinanaerobacter sp. ZZT-01]